MRRVLTGKGEQIKDGSEGERTKIHQVVYETVTEQQAI